MKRKHLVTKTIGKDDIIYTAIKEENAKLRKCLGQYADWLELIMDCLPSEFMTVDDDDTDFIDSCNILLAEAKSLLEAEDE